MARYFYCVPTKILLYVPMLIVILCSVAVSVTSYGIDPCPLSSPCSCDGSRILCNDVGFNEFPKFRKTNVTFDGWILYIGGNNIIEIPSKAFINISLILLSMAGNPLERIADDAFYGSENSVYSLFLSNTSLKEVPKSLGKLTNLHVLDLQSNAIKTLPDGIMSNLSKTLQFISLGSPQMTEWPFGIRRLTGIHVATFYNLPMSDLPEDAFRGLENTELTLYFKSPDFVSIPKALHALKSMKELDIADNLRISSSVIDKDSFKGMSLLHTLAVDNCSLTEVPNLSELHSLSDLEFTNCPISYWNEGYIANYSAVTNVILDKTLINSVPPIVSKLKNLKGLSFFGTKITNIKADDFKGLAKLEGLVLSFSPVRNISDNAFLDNKGIKSLLLDSLMIAGFPKAVKNIPTLKYLDLSNNTIECTCHAMGWLKGWSGVNYTYVDGECQNSKIQINDFLHNEVEKC